ncbi:MAG: ATP-binding cassette subfamily F protein uup [Candidatus Azotimanducaceae bacterium]|jgi:ATP-binding cassette subfamily F protein uup|tara:strand:- start:5198 stop:7105 length:1908 start_codon:yes stop_codon:yes gene_type:complete
MTLLRCDNLNIHFGDYPLLTDANFSIEPGERVCLIGRNGAGKSTLLKIILGEVPPDTGVMHRRDNLTVSVLEQQLPAAENLTVLEVVQQGLGELIELIERFSEVSATAVTTRDLEEMEVMQSRIDTLGGWQPEQQVDAIITQLGLPRDSYMSELSGGWRRRVALARALVCKPDLLLLDEPTNHLDISTIEWLEHEVRGYQGSVIFITHDRAFLQRLATRIVEIDRGQIISWPGDYTNYLQLKEQANEEEETRNALFDKRLAQEETWIRQGIKARRTRNEGRVRALESMRRERGQRLNQQGKAKIEISNADGSGKKVIEAKNVTHGYGGNELLQNFNLRVMRGDRIGIIGNNGVGKSTLLKILLGQLDPDSGSSKVGTNLTVGYFDQVRQELEWDKSVAWNVGEGKDNITINGVDRHVVGYLKNFLFTPARAMTPVSRLSGGECNRVLLAKLFTQSNNFLVLDEPTNDLDIEMLEVLEEKLVEYDGTLIIVSHDRDFMDNVVTSTLVFEGDGNVVEYQGGYSDWAARGKSLNINDTPDLPDLPADAAATADASSTVSEPKSKVKLSYKLQRELDQLPKKIEELEQKLATLQTTMADPSFYDKPFSETEPLLKEVAETQATLDTATERWMELEEMAG